MKRLGIFAVLVMTVLMLSGAAFADGAVHGDFSANWYGANATVTGGGAPATMTASASGLLIDGTLKFTPAWGLSALYTTNNGTFSGTANTATKLFVGGHYYFNLGNDNTISIFLLYQTNNLSAGSIGGGNITYSGWGGGLDGSFKLSKDWDAYANISTAGLTGNGASYTAVDGEGGVRWKFQPNWFARGGWRFDTDTTTTAGFFNYHQNGPVVGIGLTY